MNIVILSRSPFPEGNAASTYILNVCRVLTSCGHNVTVIGCRRNLINDFPPSGSFENVKYHNFDATKRSKVMVYLFDNFWGHYAVHTLSKMKNVDIVFLYGETKYVAERINKYCKKHGIKYGAFNCEWYTPDCFSKSVRKRIVAGTVELIPYNAEHADVAIQISSLLTNYFVEHNVKTIMLPNLVDLESDKWQGCRSEVGAEKLKLAYAGVPGVGKDELGVVIEAIGSLSDEQRSRVELHIWGIDSKYLEKYLGENAHLLVDYPDCFICHGRAKQEDIPKLINECHYTVLIRQPSLRTNAGFSTKMVESFASGVPFMANITGDIGTYLKDGFNGIIVEDASASACRDAIERALGLLEQNSAMRDNAYKTAVESFDYRRYISRTKEFFDSI